MIVVARLHSAQESILTVQNYTVRYQEKVGFQSAKTTEFAELQRVSCPGPTGGLTRPPKPQLNFVPPQYQLLSDGPESINISFYLFQKNDMKLKQNIHSERFQAT